MSENPYEEKIIVDGQYRGQIEQRSTTSFACEWWHLGWFVCSADPLKGKVQVGAVFPMTMEQANIMVLSLRRASDWLRAAMAMEEAKGRL